MTTMATTTRVRKDLHNLSQHFVAARGVKREAHFFLALSLHGLSVVGCVVRVHESAGKSSGVASLLMADAQFGEEFMCLHTCMRTHMYIEVRTNAR
jgi:hypothetical protein